MEKHGFEWEAFKVITEDGYILTTFHVTGSKKSGPFNPTLPPVLIQHGDMSDAASWLGYYEDGLPLQLQLAEAGYDVWLGNNRGSEYSQVHKTLSANDPEFWQYSFAEMGRYDDIANIKAIKQYSGADKIFYMGWS